jgi:hypothetical protein
MAARYPAASYDRDAWAAAILAHLEPLPDNRPWRRRHWIGPSARRHAAILEREQQHEDPTPDPADLVAHLTPEQQLEAARDAWRHLHALGLAADDPEDLPTRTLLQGVA